MFVFMLFGNKFHFLNLHCAKDVIKKKILFISLNKNKFSDRLADKKAAIGYVYEDSTESPPHVNKVPEEDDENDEDKEDDLSDLDLGKYFGI